MDDQEQEIRNFISKRAQAMARNLSPAVRPILAQTPGGLDPIGSAVLLRLANAKFLLSAAHVLDQRHDSPLLLSTTHGIRLIAGEVITSVIPASGQRDDDRFDVGVVRLSKQSCEGVPDGDWLTSAHTDVDEVGRFEPAHGSTYLVLGFMATRARVSAAERRTSVPMFMLTSVVVSPAGYKTLGVDDEGHVVLEFNRRRMNTPTGQHTAPNPRGISGGGIWGFRERQGGDPRLVGIAIECHHQPIKAIVGTRLSVFFEVIRSRWPELDEHIPRSLVRRVSASTR